MWPKVRSGQHFASTPLYDSKFVNQLIDTVETVKNRLPTARDPIALAGLLVVGVKNGTDGTIPAGSVVSIGELLTDAAKTAIAEQACFEALKPEDPLYENPFGISVRGLREGEIGDVQISGRCLATVEVADDKHRYAVLQDGSHKLKSAVGGPVRLIQKPDGTGEQELLVQVNVPVPSLLCQATGTIAANSSSTAYKILAGPPGSETDAGFTTVPPARNYFTEPLSNGDKFFLQWINNAWAIIRPAPGSGNRRFLGALDADLASADTDATVALFTALHGSGVPAGVTSAANTLRKSGQYASAIVVEEDLSGEEPTYHLMDVEHVVIEYVTQVRYDSASHKWQMKRQKATVLWEEAEGEWEDIHTLIASEVVEDVQDTGTELRETKKTIYVAEEEEGESNTISSINDCEE